MDRGSADLAPLFPTGGDHVWAHDDRLGGLLRALVVLRRERTPPDAEAADRRVVSGISRSVVPGVPINAAATLVALWSPSTALALLAGHALFYVVGSSLFGRD